VALVTGASRGIGLAISTWFLQRGHRVAVLDIDAEALASSHAALVAEHGAERLLALPADVSNAAQVAEAVAAIDARWGRLDALVNNAGVAVFKPIGQTTLDDWRWVMSVNLDGPFICTQACAPLMLKNGGGAVVNIASISGLRASTLRVAYGTSKPPARWKPRWPSRCTRPPSAPITTTPFRWRVMARSTKSPTRSAFCAAPRPVM
jgi:NAD(P)-dependent dehydrogenase (short-subunit alcohol dehydrogenase family)